MGVGSVVLEWLTPLFVLIGAAIKLVAVAFLTRLAILAADRIGKEKDKDPPPNPPD